MIILYIIFNNKILVFFFFRNFTKNILKIDDRFYRQFLLFDDTKFLRNSYEKKENVYICFVRNFHMNLLTF